MPLLFILMMCLLGIGIAVFRRSPQAFLDGPSEDMPTRLLRSAGRPAVPAARRVGSGDARRTRPHRRPDPAVAVHARLRERRAAAAAVGAGRRGVWAMIAVAVGSVGVYASVAIRYRLGVGDWVAAAILVVFLAGYLFAASALLRRAGVAVPGLLGGLFVALAWLAMRGFTFYGVIGTIPAEWKKLVLVIGVPLVVAAGTL